MGETGLSAVVWEGEGGWAELVDVTVGAVRPLSLADLSPMCYKKVIHLEPLIAGDELEEVALYLVPVLLLGPAEALT